MGFTVNTLLIYNRHMKVTFYHQNVADAPLQEQNPIRFGPSLLHQEKEAWREQRPGECLKSINKS